MGILLVTSYFYVTLENDCIIKKLNFICVQGIKKLKMVVRKSRIFPDGPRKHDGEIVHGKEDIYW